MDRFLVQNAQRHQSLVSAFDHGPASKPLLPAQETSSASVDVKICARIRPLLDEEAAAGFYRAIFPREAQSGLVDVHELKRPIRGLATLKSSNFLLDSVFPSEATTQDVYSVVNQLVPFACSGGISTLFAYGQTGSGKTFTVSGLQKLVVEELMACVRATTSTKVSVTIVELAGNAGYDLLNSRQPVSILEDSFGVIQLAGAQEKFSDSVDGLLGHIQEAALSRLTESTLKNDVSSRSHSICRLRIQTPGTAAEDGLLYMIDLAGSEAARDVASHGADRMRETREINVSLSVLKDCIRGKVEANAAALAALSGPKSERTKVQKPHIPFRRSALTKVLKHVFDPNGMRTCKTVVIACINPSIVDVGASKNTLRYAEMLRVSLPKTGQESAAGDSAAPGTWSNEKLRRWIDQNSGVPPVLSSLLAPTETGLQLLRLTPHEFEARCAMTPGMSPEQAKAFQSKIWQLHVSSRRGLPPSDASDTPKASHTGSIAIDARSSSREPDHKKSLRPFKERIRPGMVVSWTPPPGFPLSVAGGTNKALVLCPTETVESTVKDVFGDEVNLKSSDGDEPGEAKRYLCSMIVPGQMSGTFVLKLWQQVVVDAEMMTDEVCMEYDAATRYYYMVV